MIILIKRSPTSKLTSCTCWILSASLSIPIIGNSLFPSSDAISIRSLRFGLRMNEEPSVRNLLLLIEASSLTCIDGRSGSTIEPFTDLL
ncbi:inorganic polyphosphate/ATP-NAD kinase [Listeria monocytogenes]|nr:inorganic polyphosphate/ATP-NAD kinase [Listeria monocytogenes]